MDPTDLLSTDLGEGPNLQYASTCKADLERVTIEAIKEHRRLLEADQAVYDEWDRAASDPNASASLVQSLQNEYMARQEQSHAQQCKLAELIDALGYVPHVATDDNTPSN